MCECEKDWDALLCALGDLDDAGDERDDEPDAAEDLEERPDAAHHRRGLRGLLPGLARVARPCVYVYSASVGETSLQSSGSGSRDERTLEGLLGVLGLSGDLARGCGG